MIKLLNLTKIYNTSETVGIGIKDVNLEFNVGEFVAIVGASGSGKTTLLNIVSGMDTYTEGEMFVDGISTANFDSNDYENYRRGNVAFIFQNYQLIDSYTVLENVMTQLIIKGLDKKSAKTKAIELLNKVGMGKRLRHRASKLSGGEKQRVVIARALASDAKILACDEPTGNLDTKNALEIMALIKEVSKDKLVLFVTHDESLISGNATRVIKMRDGSVESDTTLESTNKLDSTLIKTNKSSIGTLFYVALKNLLRTPKKSLFVLLVFLIVSFVILFSVAYIPLDIVATKNIEIELNMFNNRDENRIVTYMDDDFNGEFNLENADVYRNDYLLDYAFKAGSTNTILNKYLKNSAKLKLTKNDLELKAGRMPLDGVSNEVVVILGADYSADFYNQILNEDAYVKFYSASQINSYFTNYYKVVGFAVSKDLSLDSTYFYFNYEGALSFLKGVRKSISTYKDSKCFESDLSLVYEGKEYNVVVNPKFAPEDIRVNFKYKDKDFNLYVGNKKVDMSKYEYRYVFDTINNYEIEMSFEAALKIVEDVDYRVSIFAEDQYLTDTINSLRENENLTVYPISESLKLIPVYDINAILDNLFNFAFIFVEIIASLFIATLITSFVLGSKKKEMSVLRVIGLNQKDVLIVLIIELLSLMVIAIMINIIVALSFNFIETSFSYLIIFDNVGKLIFSIVTLLLISLLISRSWNNKMFKKTAREALRAGE